MSNQNLTIATVEDKGSYILITATDGHKYSGFAKDRAGNPTQYMTLHPGDEIEADITTTNKAGKTYNNIGAFHVTARNAAQPAPQGQEKPSAPPRVVENGQRHGMIVKLIGDLYIHDKIDDKHRWFLKMCKEIDDEMGTGK